VPLPPLGCLSGCPSLAVPGCWATVTLSPGLYVASPAGAGAVIVAVAASGSAGLLRGPAWGPGCEASAAALAGLVPVSRPGPRGPVAQGRVRGSGRGRAPSAASRSSSARSLGAAPGFPRHGVGPPAFPSLLGRRSRPRRPCALVRGDPWPSSPACFLWGPSLVLASPPGQPRAHNCMDIFKRTRN